MNKHDVFVVGGSDMFSPGLVECIKEDLTGNVKAGFTSAQALKHWTGNAGKVLEWSGLKDPYPSYELGPARLFLPGLRLLRTLPLMCELQFAWRSPAF